ncbi:hypothetical protein GCM10027020_13910 [Nocardioides salsibiostraticola]
MSSTSSSYAPLDFSDTSQVPMGRLAKVEVRKALDTRAGRWLIIGVLALLLVVLTIFALVGNDVDKDYGTFLQISGATLGYFLPIVIILLVTSEQSQRTGLVTFALEPRRSRVVIAKFLAGLTLGVGLIILAALVAAVGTLIGVASGASPSWTPEFSLIFNGFVLANLIGVFTGFAIAMLLMNTPAAIVVYFIYSLVLPIASGILSSISSGFEKIAPWVEFNTAQSPLFVGDGSLTGQEWAQFVVAGTIWLIVPLALGVARLLRIEFK